MVTKKPDFIQDAVPVSSWYKFSFHEYIAVLPVGKTKSKV
jgi:hypothetical protein